MNHTHSSKALNTHMTPFTPLKEAPPTLPRKNEGLKLKLNATTNARNTEPSGAFTGHEFPYGFPEVMQKTPTANSRKRKQSGDPEASISKRQSSRKVQQVDYEDYSTWAEVGEEEMKSQLPLSLQDNGDAEVESNFTEADEYRQSDGTAQAMPSLLRTALNTSMYPSSTRNRSKRRERVPSEASATTIRPAGSITTASRVVTDHAILKLFQELLQTPGTMINLPRLFEHSDIIQEKAYTAEVLLQIYLLAYQHQSWNMCDMIADTWIRAFHLIRAEDRKHPHYRGKLWRPNKVIDKMQQDAEHEVKIAARRNGGVLVPAKPVGFDEHPPKYNLEPTDPWLDPNVTVFDADLIHQLYTSTRKDCGARLLWADAMALCGDRVEATLAADRGVWDPDVIFNIMCSSLRMVRRKLTLKIEEGTEGAWCLRYHEHGSHGLPCYRQLAHREARVANIIPLGDEKATPEMEDENDDLFGAALEDALEEVGAFESESES